MPRVVSRNRLAILLLSAAFVVGADDAFGQSSSAAPAGAPPGSPEARVPAVPTGPSTSEVGGPALRDALTGAAKLDFDAAHLLYDNGDFAGALIKFKSAYDRSKDPRLLWDAAACEKSLRHYAKAAKLVQRYLRDGGDSLGESARADAQAFLQAAAPFLSHLTLTVNEPGANVYVDDEIVGVTPLAEPLLLSIGSPRIRVAKDGFTEYADNVEVSGAGDIALQVTLAREVHEGRVRVQAGEGQSISVDQQVVGVGQWEGVLASGGHTLRVSAKGKRPYQSEVVVQDRQLRTVDVTLEDEPHGGVPTWVWIGGAVLVAGGAAVGGYFLFKPSDTPGSPSVIGTAPDGLVRLAAFQAGH